MITTDRVQNVLSSGGTVVGEGGAKLGENDTPTGQPRAPSAEDGGGPTGASRPPGARRTVMSSRDRTSVVAREKEEYGGIKVGSAFLGWLTATGMAILLTAVTAAATLPAEWHGSTA